MTAAEAADREIPPGDRGRAHVFGGAEAMDGAGAPADPGRLDPITLLPNRRQFQTDSASWGNVRATLVLITLADPQTFNDILRVLGHTHSESFIKAGAARLLDILGPGTAIYHVNLLSFAFRLPGLAEPDAPAMIDRISRRLPRADLLRRRADRHPHRHRHEGAGPRRRQPRRGPARDALRRPGQPQLAHRLVLVRPQDRRSAPPRLPAAVRSQARARLREPARAALPAQGHARHRRLRQRRGAAALDASRARPDLARRVRRSSPRRPRWSPR